MDLPIFITKLVSYTLQSFDSAGFVVKPLSNLVNNLGEGIRKIKCKSRHNNKKGETRRIKYKDCNYFYKHTNFKDNVTVYQCLCCNKNYEKSLMKTERNEFLKYVKFLTKISIS